jgi:hypothetical protein
MYRVVGVGRLQRGMLLRHPILANPVLDDFARVSKGQ